MTAYCLRLPSLGTLRRADPNYWDAGIVFTMLGGGLLVFELLSVPLWLKLVHKVGKYRAYVYWNCCLVVSTGCKIFIGKDDVMTGLAIGEWWTLHYLQQSVVVVVSVSSSSFSSSSSSLLS